MFRHLGCSTLTEAGLYQQTLVDLQIQLSPEVARLQVITATLWKISQNLWQVCQQAARAAAFCPAQKPPYSYIALITMAINSRWETQSKFLQFFRWKSLHNRLNLALFNFVMLQSLQADDPLWNLPLDHVHLPVLQGQQVSAKLIFVSFTIPAPFGGLASYMKVMPKWLSDRAGRTPFDIISHSMIASLRFFSL